MHNIRLQPAAFDIMSLITHFYPFLSFFFFILNFLFYLFFYTHPAYSNNSCLIIVVKNFP